MKKKKSSILVSSVYKILYPIAFWLVHVIFSKPQTGSNAPCETVMHTIVVQCSPDAGLMNINISQCESDL